MGLCPAPVFSPAWGSGPQVTRGPPLDLLPWMQWVLCALWIGGFAEYAAADAAAGGRGEGEVWASLAPAWALPQCFHPIPSAPPLASRAAETRQSHGQEAALLVSPKWSPSFARKPPGTKGVVKTQILPPLQLAGSGLGPGIGMSSITLPPHSSTHGDSDMPGVAGRHPELRVLADPLPAHWLPVCARPSSSPGAWGGSAAAASWAQVRGAGRPRHGSASTTTPTGSWSAPTRAAWSAARASGTSGCTATPPGATARAPSSSSRKAAGWTTSIATTGAGTPEAGSLESTWAVAGSQPSRVLRSPVMLEGLSPPWICVPLPGSPTPTVPHRISVCGEGFGWAALGVCLFLSRVVDGKLCLQAGVRGHRGEPPGVLLLLRRQLLQRALHPPARGGRPRR